MVVRHAARRGRALGINGIFGGLGMAVAPGVTGFLTSTLGWRAAFVVPGVACLAVGIAFAWFVREIAPAAPAAKEQAGNGNGHHPEKEKSNGGGIALNMGKSSNGEDLDAEFERF